MRIAIIADNLVVNIIEAETMAAVHLAEEQSAMPAYDWTQIDDVLLDGELPPSPAYGLPSPEELLQLKQAAIVSAVQQHLDAFAQTRGYDGILSAASYVSSINPKFAAEGQCAVEVRDLTWDKCWQIFTEFMSGQRPEPTLDEIMAELPVLEWPEV